MTNFSTIENKITSIQKYLKILDNYKKYSREEIENKFDIRGSLERYLYLAIQAAIELAEAVISFRDFREPTTLKESFEILENKERGIGEGLSLLWMKWGQPPFLLLSSKKWKLIKTTLKNILFWRWELFYCLGNWRR